MWVSACTCGCGCGCVSARAWVCGCVLVRFSVECGRVCMGVCVSVGVGAGVWRLWVWASVGVGGCLGVDGVCVLRVLCVFCAFFFHF